MLMLFASKSIHPVHLGWGINPRIKTKMETAREKEVRIIIRSYSGSKSGGRKCLIQSLCVVFGWGLRAVGQFRTRYREHQSPCQIHWLFRVFPQGVQLALPSRPVLLCGWRILLIHFLIKTRWLVWPSHPFFPLLLLCIPGDCDTRASPFPAEIFCRNAGRRSEEERGRRVPNSSQTLLFIFCSCSLLFGDSSRQIQNWKIVPMKCFFSLMPPAFSMTMVWCCYFQVCVLTALPLLYVHPSLKSPDPFKLDLLSC